MNGDLEITAVEMGGTLVLRLSGCMDAKTAPRMLAHGRRARDGARHLVLNMSNVTLIASSGIGGLLALAEELRQAHRTLRIVDPAPGVDAVLRLLNLHKFLPIDATEDVALEALKAA